MKRTPRQIAHPSDEPSADSALALFLPEELRELRQALRVPADYTWSKRSRDKSVGPKELKSPETCATQMRTHLDERGATRITQTAHLLYSRPQLTSGPSLESDDVAFSLHRFPRHR
jgi:hypothetical protein